MQHLKHSKALVTGASKGLGKAIAFKLGQMGSTVTFVARNEDLLRENVDLLNRMTSIKHTYVATDLRDLVDLGTSHQQNQLLIEKVKDATILINCAGETSHTLLASHREEDIKDMVALNLTVPLILTKLAIKPMLRMSMLKARDQNANATLPNILNVSSILSLTDSTLPGTSVYAATKAGLLGFTTSLAAETKNRIRINAILPGLIEETEMGSLVSHSHAQNSVALSRVVDETVKLLLDNESNGKCVTID